LSHPQTGVDARSIPEPAAERCSLLGCAPMQDVTDLRFMHLIGGYGNQTFYFTEYFRVLPGFALDPQILASITQNPTGHPVIAR